jgi:GNAT superfamily N-acetyltransferase
MATQVNPSWLAPEDYTALLSRAFPGEWDRETYDWYLARPFNGRRGDLLVQAEGSRLCACMAMIPRQVKVDDTPPIDVAILAAGATLPEERSRGRYAQLLEAALERGRRLGYVALLGFVTAGNASGRGLVRLGARALRSFYIVSADSAPRRGSRHTRPQRPITPDAALSLLAQSRTHRSSGASGAEARFHYAQEADWSRQFIHRPHRVRAVRLRHDSVALIESVCSTDRLQNLNCSDGNRTASIAAVAAASAAAGRRFFMYTLDPCEAAAARRLGLKVRDGYLMLLPTGHGEPRWRSLAAARWHVESGDRL